MRQRFAKGLERDIVLARQKRRCAGCQTALFDGNIDIDHIVPWCLSKDTSLSNLQALCPSCHAYKSRKYDHQAVQFVKRFYSRARGISSQRPCMWCKRIVSAHFTHACVGPRDVWHQMKLAAESAEIDQPAADTIEAKLRGYNWVPSVKGRLN